MNSKSATSLENLSKTDCVKAYDALKANAEVLFSTAKYAASEGNYGVARSLLILGSEEYIKGAILFLKSIGVNAVRIPEVSGALKNSHKLRHEAAMLIKLLNAVAIFFDWEEFTPQPNRNSGNLGKLLFYAKQVGNKALLASEALTDLQWWEQADNYKNAGLYVSYHIEFILPQSVTKQDYDAATKKVKKLVKSFRLFELAVIRSCQQERAELVKLLNDAVKIHISQNKEEEIKRISNKAKLTVDNRVIM